MGGGELDKLFAAFAFIVSLPVAVLLGIFLGIKLRSASPWRFAGPRQVIITVIAAFLLLGFNSLFQEMGLMPRRVPLRDPFVTASTNQIIQSLGDPKPEMRLRAAEELVRRKHASAGDLILPLLQDKDGHVRGRATALLGLLRERRAVDRIIALLDDPDYETQLDAVRSLGDIGDSRAVDPLLAVIDRPNFSGVVAEALAKIGDRRAAGPLIAFLEKATREDQLRTRNWFVESLEKLSGQKFGNDVAKWKRWYETEGKQ
jgi:hypothetical protein